MHPRTGKRSAGSQWLSVAVAVAVLLSLVAAVDPALAAPHRVVSRVVAHVDPATAYVGTPVVVRGSVTPPAAGPVLLQSYVRHAWRTVGHGRTTRAGSFSLSVRAPRTPVSLLLRVFRPASRTAKAAAAASFRVRVVKVRFTVTAGSPPGQLGAGQPIVVTGAVKPKATGTVLLQRLVSHTWRTIASTRLSKRSRYAFRTLQPTGAYPLRVSKPFTTHIAGGVSPRFTVTVLAPLTITTTSLPAGTVGRPYTATLAGQGGAGPLSWSVASGAPPAGLTLSTAGLLAGTPKASGPSTFTLTVTDAGGRASSSPFAVAVAVATGTVSAWGANSNGQLGDGVRPDRPVPARVAGLSGVTAVASGVSTSYALTGAGAVLAWGVGTKGELGNGSNAAFTAAPTPVTGLVAGAVHPVVSIAAGEHSAYALKDDGSVWAWGRNDEGEVGNGSTAGVAVPVAVSGLSSGVTAIAAGGYNGYALKSDGTVWAWGYNGSGDLGDGLTADSAVPVQVESLADMAVIAVVAGWESGYVLMADHSVRSWGLNGYGQLGHSGTTNTLSPGNVTGLASGVASLVAGDYTAYALKSDGTVLAWGEGYEGELGNGAVLGSEVPVPVSGLTGLTVGSVAASASTGYTVLSDHTLRGWGTNVDGELGTGAVSPFSSTPVAGGPSGVAAVTGRAHSVLALGTDGSVWAWGFDHAALLDSSTARTVAGISAVVAVAGGIESAVALRADGSVWTWGGNVYGTLGVGPIASTVVPLQVTGLSGVTAVASFGYDVYALRGDGTVWAWGYAGGGALGDGSTTSSGLVPVQVSGLTGVRAIAAGMSSGYALKDDGTVWSWGENGHGQLGDGTSTNRRTPVRVGSLTSIAAIGAGRSAYAVSTDGTVLAWGQNDSGQLGDNTLTDRSLPVPVVGVTGATAVVGGQHDGYALRADGSVAAWGRNSSGELGNGTTVDSLVAVTVQGLNGVRQLAAGWYTGYALMADRTEQAWGSNQAGSLGVGSTVNSSVPLPVPGLSDVIDVAGSNAAGYAVQQS